MADDRLRVAERALLETASLEHFMLYRTAWERSGRLGRAPESVLIEAFERTGLWPRDPRLDPTRGDVVLRIPQVLVKKHGGPGGRVLEEGEPEAWRVENAFFHAHRGDDLVIRQRVAIRDDGTPGKALPRSRENYKVTSLAAWRKFVKGGRVLAIAKPFGK